MVELFLITIGISLVFIAVDFLLLAGLKFDGDSDAEAFFENKFYVTGTLLGMIAISFIPLVNIIGMAAIFIWAKEEWLCI